MATSPGHTTDGVVMSHEASTTDDNGLRTVIASSACNRCRSRKVKCDRTQPVCTACVRLKFHCTYDRRSISPVPEPGDRSSYTEAGTRRKRARQACEACRNGKARCSGRGPCERCVSRRLVCDLLAKEAAHGGDDGVISIPTPTTLPSVISGTTPLWSEKATARHYLDIYFDTASRMAPVFLHKPSILLEWSKGDLDINLLKCIVAFGMFMKDSRPDGRVTARAMMQEVQDDTLRKIGRQTLAHLRVLVMLLRFRFQAGQFPDAWSLLALAARSAFTMRLNYEHSNPDPLVQESNRRLVWAIYQLDRLYSGGMEDLAVIPVERMHIRLPCDERSFEMGMGSKAGFLDETSMDPSANVDAHSFKLRLLAIRDRILRYTKSVRRKGDSPAGSRSAMEALQAELNTFERTLPAELKLTSQRLVFMGHSREAGPYVGLHTLWMMCHCDLYRFCVPGIRESVSKDALALTPPNFIEYCQHACFSTAIRLCGLWSDLYRLESSEYFGDELLAVSIYQVAQILHHLPHLIPEDGEDSVLPLKKRLIEALQLAAPLGQVYTSAMNCLKDSERLINALGRASVTQSSPDSSVSAAIETAEREHLASKHSVLPHLYRDQNIVDRGTGHPEAKGQRSNMLPPNDGRITSSNTNATLPVSQSDHERREYQEMEPGFSDMFLFDPFNMQLNGYYDPELDGPFM